MIPTSSSFKLSTALTLLTGFAYAGPEPSPSLSQSDSFLDDFKLDAEIRIRAEWTDNLRDYNSNVNAADDDGWLITRTRVGLGYEPTDWLKFYVQGQDAHEFFSGRPHNTLNGANGDDFDLRQAYIGFGNLEDSSLSFLIGRQPLDFGSRRIVADSGWSNYGRTFDAARLTWQVSKDWKVDAFAGNVVTILPGEFNKADWHSDLTGLFASGKLGSQTLEFYAFHLDSEGSRIAAVRGNFLTLGSRLLQKPGKSSPWDYEIEAAFQTGTVFNGGRDLDLLAFAGHGTLGYTFSDVAWSPRVSVNYSYASGDSDRTDGDQGRFQPLYPSTHNMNGLLDSIGWANLHDPYVEVTLTPAKDWKVGFQAHAFFRAEDGDFVYRSNGSSALRAPAAPNSESYIGTELDLYVQTNITRNLEILAGAGTLFAGDYLETTGTSDTAKTAYLQLTYKY